ncbi:hypothetical protein TSAR_006232 [Trichomalopsis sarcophagae]|uniref:Uncharacterized protein n=1 Tax=Trichomalopsis sarcophagae TaxID=543379 RepID=A0A232ETY5_9HYME|nr:hypothetical protein TSAR_006232 [Trichomalopsis sarcophagae]
MLDEVFEISQVANVMEPAEDEDIVGLKKDVKFNVNAYKDAFKTTKDQKFFTLSNTTLNPNQMINSNRSEASHFTVNLQHQLNEQLDSDQAQSEVEK